MRLPGVVHMLSLLGWLGAGMLAIVAGLIVGFGGEPPAAPWERGK